MSEKKIGSSCQTKSFDGIEVTGDASAIYNVTDFNQTAISVILETVFDKRIHLTEKTLRPIACGHPFILVAGPGSLKLLRSYGFQTFEGHIDESYDNIQDDNERLTAIVAELDRIKSLPVCQQQKLVSQCREIAKHNRKHFFSDDFFNTIVNELEHNVNIAFNCNQGQLDLDLWWNTYQWYKKNKMGSILTRPYKKLFLPLYRKLRLSRTNNNSSPFSI